jgi:transposase InsO family protein
MILKLIDEAVASGARLQPACEVLGLSVRTIGRWREQGGGDDRRDGPKSTPANKLSPAEQREILNVANSPKFRDLSPNQIVPRLADEGTYIGSESTFYRLLREHQLLAHRQPSRPPTSRRLREHVATGACQLWSWDITYMKSPVRGIFYYLYMIVDIWSRKIVGWQVHPDESAQHAAELFCETCAKLGIDPQGIVFHADNGGPMKGATMLATLQRLGVIASFSRPGVSDDNPYSEALYRTMKYRPNYPSRPFASLQKARAWVDGFVAWYNTEHLHSAIRFLAPEDRHLGRQEAILDNRKAVYEKARRRHPERWAGATRNWTPVGAVRLNPEKRPTVNADLGQAN